MNIQEKQYFEALSKDRTDSANTLEKPSMRGIKKSVVEKYSDQAHFIYELLQNADDAKATSVRFILESDRLIFAHNGTRHFSITNPAEEDRDSEEGRLGDINSITSIANSNKTQASIGKFGGGFKAVFQYTSTPHIYDPEFRFRIDRFIVPTPLIEDFPGRHPEETLFVFPFDHPDRDKDESYDDISDKLKNLSFPLLFLSGIKSIEFEFKDVLGLYGKDVIETRQFEDTIAELICLTHNNGDDVYDENLWLFSRIDENDHKYSTGFFVDKEGHLLPIKEPAFCFFPTKEVTGLNFIIHAPFLLTDSREGIRAGVAYNDLMLQSLASLSADALVYLRDIGEEKNVRYIDDNIFNIIPIDPEQFSDPENKRKVSFLPFYNSIQKKLASHRLLPSSDGCVSSSNAYWASVIQIPQLFNNEQLSFIVENVQAKWVFVSYGREETQKRNNKALFSYLDSLVRTNLNEDIIISGRSRESYYNRVLGIRQSLENIKGITAEFIEAQTFDWLHSFYKWLSETKHRTEISKDKPFFIDQNGKATAAFDKSGHSILFLPVKEVSGFRVVHPELLKNPDTRSFIEQIGIKQPSLKDQIYNIILPMYRKGGEIDTDTHFMLFFKYFCKCSNDEVDDFIDLIKDYSFLTYFNAGDPQSYRGTGSSMYLPTPDLVRYFGPKDEVRFIALGEYRELVGQTNEKQLISFLKELGVRTQPQIYRRESNGYYHKESEAFIDGLLEYISFIEQKGGADDSFFLWNQLCSFAENNRLSWNILNKAISTRPDGRYNFRTSYEESETATALKTKKWLVNVEGIFDAPQNMSLNRISQEYSLEIDGAELLLQFLAMPDDEPTDTTEEDDTNLTDSQKEKIEFANKLMEMGIDEDDLEEFREFKRQKEARKRAEEKHEAEGVEPDNASGSDKTTGGSNDNADNDDDYLDDLEDDDEDTTTSKTSAPEVEKRKLDKTTSRVVKDIVQRTKAKPSEHASSAQTVEDEPDIDQDEYTRAPVDYSKRIEKAKQKSASEIEKIAYFEELQAKAMEAKKYSYGWFKALLELESINSGETNANSKEVSIAFAKIEREPGTKRTLVLKYPNRYIHQFMEDLADIPLVLHMGDKTKTVPIEVANIKSYTLRVKMKNSADIDGIELSTVTSVTIDAKSPAFLLEELRKQFNELGEVQRFEDDYDMQSNLCENIEFVFGPPGTGKTTYLAQNVLIPMMQNNADCKVLVLTPTNKSADVLVSRIMEVSKDTSYNKWLVRFGTTIDEKIEQSNVFRDKTFDIRTLRRNVTVTTIARFPYDFFMPQGARIFLHGINWDYIVIDEASMIPIANIVFPLYKKTPRKFIIAGDPFQIEPITSVNLWKNENIYTMVKLDSFTNPKTIPYQYKVELLTTQYRSIPDIGYVFSNFVYGGILQHYRSADSQRPLNVGDDLGVETLNIIKFPVSKYESIYRCKRLQHSSSYQVYSALFTFEYVCYLSKAIAANNPGSLFTIGVIAPYRAQADMIDKLLASEKLPKEVDVQAGTIHGFQGDECDIIFAVFNTPPTISNSGEMFLNKRNIINVSISRARDYLFIVMPDENTENITNLRLVKRVEQLTHDTDAWNEFLSPDLEELMFGDSKYLENNAFSTSHQSVNVYGLPEKCYEVRTEDAAVDVQIHKGIINNPAGRLFSDEEENDVDRFERPSSVLESSILDQTLIPKELRKDAIDLPVRGAIKGWCYLVPYNGKLKSHTLKKTVAMFVPQIRNGQEKMVSVSVVEEDRIIYISKDMFKLYEKGLSEPEGIELRKKIYE